TESTKNVLLEAAYFLPASIRRTARELNLPSDASYRFERGVDPEMVLRASQRATELIQEIAGGIPAKEINVSGNLPANPADVSLRYEKCDRVVGIAIKPKTVDDVLTRFGLKKISAAKITQWKVPSYRRDLQHDVDLIEEVVRAYGVERIPGTDQSRFTPSSKADRAHDLELQMRERLVAAGLTEVRTSKLLSRKRFAFAENAIELRNPLSEDHVALRPSLLSGLLGVLDHNVRAGAKGLAIFETGRVFEPPGGAEKKRIAILLWGNRGSEVHWRTEKRPFDFFDLKGTIELTRKDKLSFQRAPQKNRDMALTVDILAKHELIGMAGQLSNALSSKLDAPGAVFVAEVSLDFPETNRGLYATFRELGKFPAVTRDIAMIVPDTLSHEEISDVILQKEALLETVAFFDRVVGKEAEQLFGPGKKSVAYRLTYRDRSRTLTSEEVNAAHAKIRERLRSDLGAELRE
ncbi:MAG: phenylalanine--tRNA ligase subunit beta, partial [Candidatus Udaeobacter sp.]